MRRSLALLLLLFALVGGQIRLAAQLPDTISLTKKFSYRQTGPNTLVDYQPSLAVQVRFSGNLPDTTQVTLRTGSSSFTVPRNTTAALGTTIFSGLWILSDQAALNLAAPGGPCSLNVTGGASTTTVAFAAAFDPTLVAPRFTNFDALQGWNTDSLQFFWQPIPDADSADAPVFTLDRANGLRFFDSSDTATNPVGLAPNASAVGVIGVVASPGDLFFGTLSYHRFRAAGTADGGARTTFFQDVEVRVPVVRLAPLPVIATHPTSQSVAIGTAATLTVSAAGIGLTYQWKKDGVTLPGATGDTYRIASAQLSHAGIYTVTIANSGGSVTSFPATLGVVATLFAPTNLTTPVRQTVTAGDRATFRVSAGGTAPFNYQWLHDGASVRGATSETLTLNSAQPSDTGSYSVTVTNNAGSVTIPAGSLSVIPLTRISNLSILTTLTTPGDTFTLGYVIGNASAANPKPLVIRAAGPSLASIGVSGTLDDPRLETFSGATKTGENDNWAGTAALASAASSVGAFPFTGATSKDAALLASASARDNSVRISSTNGGLGQVIAEVYDATPSPTFTSASPRLLNISVLKSLGPGLTVGFTLSGNNPKTILLRAIGPTLASFGVAGAATDPQLTLFNSGSGKIGDNDNWGGTPQLSAAFANVGAFALAPTSRDAALLVTLSPGGYSVQVTGTANTSGVALVEVYEVP